MITSLLKGFHAPLVFYNPPQPPDRATVQKEQSCSRCQSFPEMTTQT